MTRARRVVSALPLLPFCKICQRVPFGDIVQLAGGQWRHDACAFGSVSWKEYYDALPEGADKQRLSDYAACFIGSVEEGAVSVEESEGSNNLT